MNVHACAAAAMAAFISLAPAIPTAHAETTLCTEITALPFTITAQGVYCLKQNLNVNLSASGSAAITINAGNVTIDFNGFRVNNQAPLATNEANGVYAQDRKNITVQNGFIRGFNRGIFLDEVTVDASANHLVEGMKIADSGAVGILVEGDKSVVRDNRVLDTGGGPANSANGILLQVANDGLVADNIVSGVSETSLTNGIGIGNLTRARVHRNEVTNVDGTSSDRGIALAFVGQVVITGNKLLNNPETGADGILSLNGIDIICRDNEVDGFGETPFSGCSVTNGNRNAFD